jgi:hypothetical protein
MSRSSGDEYQRSDKETERLREATLKRMLATPPQPRGGKDAPKKRKPKAGRGKLAE